MTVRRALLILLVVFLMPALAWAQVGTRATFTTSKDFTDGNTGEITVTINCNTGLPLEQEQEISEGTPVEFVKVDFDDGTLDCTIEEEDPAGYVPTYSTDEGATFTTDGCEFDDVTDASELTCLIVNTPGPVAVDISKVWVIEGEQDSGVDLEFSLRLECDSEIVGGNDQGDGDWDITFFGEGPLQADFSADVVPNFPTSTCFVDEDVFDSAVETSNGCGPFTVAVTDGHACTITNTVFFEGIPTLSQYGLAILALLMLGVGFVGFRRLV